MTIYDSTPRQVIRRQHHADTIAFEYPDLELAHLSRRISENLVTILEQNPIVPVRQNLGDHAFHLNAFFFGHPGPPQEFTEARRSRRVQPAVESCGSMAGTQPTCDSPPSPCWATVCPPRLEVLTGFERSRARPAQPTLRSPFHQMSASPRQFRKSSVDCAQLRGRELRGTVLRPRSDFPGCCARLAGHRSARCRIRCSRTDTGRCAAGDTTAPPAPRRARSSPRLARTAAAI